MGAPEIRRNVRKAHQNQRTKDDLSAQTVILQASCRTAANHVVKTTVVTGVQLGFVQMEASKNQLFST
jgi:precorrin isomerase